MAKQKNAAEEESVERIRAAVASGEVQSAPPDANGNGAATAKPKESKAERFVRLARMRQPKFEKVANALLNLSSKAQYEATDAQREKIVGMFKRAYDRAVAAFGGGTVTSDDPYAV